MALRLLLTAAVIAAAFVVLHSGGLGDATCEGSRFVPSSGFSVWPPGARCDYGEPARTDVVINGWFAALVAAALVTVALTARKADPAAAPNR